MEYFIVILNWNGWHDTQKCIESIRTKSLEDNFTIILVDNGSKDDEVKKIDNYCNSNFSKVLSNSKQYFLSKDVVLSESFKSISGKDKIIIIKNEENLGFAKGNNVALKFLQNVNERYVILLNNDTVIGNNALNKMFNFFINYPSKIGAIVPQIRYYGSKEIIWNCGGTINLLGIRRYDYAMKNASYTPQRGYKKIDYGTGCVILMNLPETGILTEKFFFGEEDMELAFRLRKLKLPIYCLYDAIVFHKVGASREQISDNFVGKVTYHYCQRINNLKNQLWVPSWILSILVHMLSSIKILIETNKFKIITFVKMWIEVLKNSTKKQFDVEDFHRISNKIY